MSIVYSILSKSDRKNSIFFLSGLIKKGRDLDKFGAFRGCQGEMLMVDDGS